MDRPESGLAPHRPVAVDEDCPAHLKISRSTGLFIRRSGEEADLESRGLIKLMDLKREWGLSYEMTAAIMTQAKVPMVTVGGTRCADEDIAIEAIEALQPQSDESTIESASADLFIGADTLRKYIANGRIPVKRKLGRIILLDNADVQALGHSLVIEDRAKEAKRKAEGELVRKSTRAKWGVKLGKKPRSYRKRIKL